MKAWTNTDHKRIDSDHKIWKVFKKDSTSYWGLQQDFCFRARGTKCIPGLLMKMWKWKQQKQNFAPVYSRLPNATEAFRKSTTLSINTKQFYSHAIFLPMLFLKNLYGCHIKYAWVCSNLDYAYLSSVNDWLSALILTAMLAAGYLCKRIGKLIG